MERAVEKQASKRIRGGPKPKAKGKKSARGGGWGGRGAGGRSVEERDRTLL